MKMLALMSLVKKCSEKNKNLSQKLKKCIKMIAIMCQKITIDVEMQCMLCIEKCGAWTKKFMFYIVLGIKKNTQRCVLEQHDLVRNKNEKRKKERETRAIWAYPNYWKSCILNFQFFLRHQQSLASFDTQSYSLFMFKHYD